MKTSAIDFHPAGAEMRRDPYPHYRRLRQHPALFRVKDFGWLVSRYDDAAYVLNHAEDFSSSAMAQADSALLGSDPPKHTRTRGIISTAFSAMNIRALEDSIRLSADDLLRRVADAGEWDFMSELAGSLPVITIANLLAIPPEREQDLKRWSEAVVLSHTAPARQSIPQGYRESIVQCEAYLRSVIKDRQRNPGSDLISLLLHPECDSDCLGDELVLSFSKLLLVAATDTTTCLIGNAVLALLRNPEQSAKLKSDISLIPAAIEETLRYDSPVQFIVRRARRDLTLAQTQIPAGDRVVVMLGSANRDESRFPDPDRFDISRKARGHLGFGVGIHYCLGGMLARLEAKIAVDKFLSIAPSMHLADDLNEIALVESIQLRGPKSLRLLRSCSP